MNYDTNKAINIDMIPDNPYFLLTPGPLSTSKTVRQSMLLDWCTWDADYNRGVVQKIRAELLRIATGKPEDYTVVLLQGSGSFGVEACLGTAIPRQGGKLLVIENGAYGQRIAGMMAIMGRPYTTLSYKETEIPAPEDVEVALKNDPAITHVALVHCETTTGILNPIEEIIGLAKAYGKTVILDAMSSFGGIPMDVADLNVDFLVSSANKCIQGVPGFSFIIAKTKSLLPCKGNAHSMSLDLFDQWQDMDKTGKWRFTSPTHVVRGFLQALTELKEEGGVEGRYSRYIENQRILSSGMEALGYKPLLPRELQSPIITSFLYPHHDFDFLDFYEAMKAKGFVLYPGKISEADTFRVGNIGHIFPENMKKLIEAVSSYEIGLH